MLIYEKQIDSERHLFGTMANIPAEEDVQLSFLDADGNIINPELSDTYLDDKKGGIIRKSDNKAVNVFIGDKNIIPGDFVPPTPERKLVSIEFKVEPTKVEYLVGEAISLEGAVVEAVYDNEDRETVTSECTFVPAEGDLATEDMTKITAKYEKKKAEVVITVVPENVEVKEEPEQ